MRGYGGNYGYGLGDSMMGGSGSWLGLVLMLVIGTMVIAGIVLLVMWAMRSHSGQGQMAAMPPAGAAGHDEAVAIAKRRLAGGEIDHEQYEAIMRSLNG